MTYTLEYVQKVMNDDIDKRLFLMLDCDLSAVDFPYKKLMNHMLQMIEKNRMFAIGALRETDTLRSNLTDISNMVFFPVLEEDERDISDKEKLDYIEDQLRLLGIRKRKEHANNI